MPKEPLQKSFPQQTLLPRCLTYGSDYSIAFDGIKCAFERNPGASVKFILVGSAHRKPNPPDADILLINNNCAETIAFIRENQAKFNLFSNMNHMLPSENQKEAAILKQQLEDMKNNYWYQKYQLREWHNAFSYQMSIAPVNVSKHYLQKLDELLVYNNQLDESYQQQYNALLQQIEALTSAQFYSSLPENSIPRILAELCYGGATITDVYEKDKRSIIKMQWRSATLEFNLEYSSTQAHADVSDFTINTLYYNIVTGKYESRNEYASEDMHNKILRAAHDNADLMFENDITIFLRGLRIIGSENYTVEQKLLTAMQALPKKLPNAINAMNPDRLTADKIRLFCSGYAVNMLDFIEENQLFDYLFPANSIESEQEEKQKKFLFRKVAKACDALYRNDDSNENFPTTLVNRLGEHSPLLKNLEHKAKLMLCLFDHALNNIDAPDRGKSPEKYTIYKHLDSKGFYSMGFYSMDSYMSIIDKAGKDLIALYLSDYQKEISVEDDFSSSNGTTTEEYCSESEDSKKDESDTRSTMSSLSIIGDTSFNNRSKIKNKNKNKAKKKKRQEKSKEESEKENTISTAYSSGLNYLWSREYTMALDSLTLAVIHNEKYRPLLKSKADNIASRIEHNEEGITPQESLQAATLFYSIDDKNKALQYYLKFFEAQANLRITGDEENKEAGFDFSFVYLKLLMINFEINKQDIAKKYINEIYYNPTIHETIKKQAYEYTAHPDRALLNDKQPSAQLGFSEWQLEQKYNYARGLYYTVLINHTEAINNIKKDAQQEGSPAIADLSKHVIDCYLQLNKYTECIPYFEEIFSEYKNVFAKEYSFLVNKFFIEIKKSISEDACYESFSKKSMLGKLKSFLDQYKESISLFQNALDIEQKMNHSELETAKINKEKAIIYAYLGVIYVNLSDMCDKHDKTKFHDRCEHDKSAASYYKKYIDIDKNNGYINKKFEEITKRAGVLEKIKFFSAGVDNTSESTASANPKPFK